MRILIQRVKKASVQVNEEIIGAISKGLLVFLSISKEDVENYSQKIDYLIKKLLTIKFFAGENKKFEKDIKEVDGQILIVSQFTLDARVKKGTKPDFLKAALPKDAEKIYNEFVERLQKKIKTATGEFGAYMQVELVNDGPVTFLIIK